MTDGVGSRLVLRARELQRRGRAAVGAVPTPDELTALPEDRRRAVLQGLRPELYAISSLVAEAAVELALANREEHPPYGLVRSGHTTYRMLLASPETVAEGTIDNFYDLGKAYVDTMVFHLDRLMQQWKASEQAWLLYRLDQLLDVFRTVAGPAAQARLRDRFSFMYGGLHFGTSVCVQLAEVMVTVLEPYPDLATDHVKAVLLRSARPANRLAAFNLDHVVIAHQDLLDPAPAALPGGMRWLDPAKFAVEESDGQPWRIDFRNEETLGAHPRGRQLLDVPTTYETQGCPARISPSGGTSPIVRLWTWCVELTEALGLLDA